MNYKVSFDSLDNLNNNIRNQCAAWNEELGNIQAAVNEISGSSNISGAGADRIRDYFESVHGTIIAAMSEIMQAHSNNNLVYKQDYQTNIDTNLHAMIESDELNSIVAYMGTFRASTRGVEENVTTALNSVKDIFPLTLQQTDYVYGAQDAVKNFITTLDENICELEDRHYGADFPEVENAILALREFVNEQLLNPRSYKESFTVQRLAGSESLVKLYQQCKVLDDKQQENSAALDKAIDNENARVAALQQEYEEREEKMKVVKWVVTGVCIIGSIAAIAFTGGAATPLVVGAVSAVSGAVMSGANSVIDQYTASGDVSNTNWKDVGKNAAVGGVTGFVTGAVGAGVSGAVTSGLSQTAAGATLLNSSNAAVRIGTGAVIGSVSEVSSGVVSRGASTFIVTGDINAAADEAFNLENIAFDAVIGGVSGGINSAKSPMGKKMGIDDFDNDVMNSKPLNSPDPEKWIKNGGQVNVDGNGTWTYTSNDGVSVCYTNDYPDFKRAGLVKDNYTVENGFDTRNHSVDINQAKSATGKGGAGSGMTWHHNQDGSTLQLVPSKYHKMFTHRGGFSIAKGG